MAINSDDLLSVNDAVPLTGLDPVVAEAKKRWDKCSEWESPFRERFIDDVKFANGDSDNGFQWPNAIRRARDTDQKPCLTINLTRQHNLQIINEGKQNKTEIKIMPSGGGASVESAELLEALLRHVAYQSRAEQAYQTAREWQVEGGIGWWRIVADYVAPDSFDQEILIKRVADPLSVYCDPDCHARDKHDMNFAFVYDTMPKEEFEEMYPQFKNKANLSPLGSNQTSDDLINKDHIRIVEYFRKEKVEDEAVSFIDPSSNARKSLFKSKLPGNIYSKLKEDPLTRTRSVWREEIQWYLIVAEEIVDSTIWPGKYIPLVPVLGEETVIAGILDRKGHTRYAKDAQRMFNYNASSQVEFVATQGKTPWLAPLAAIEELETYWNTANLVNHAVLPWRHLDDQGQPIPPPSKTPPPSASPAFQAGMDTAFNQMMMVSGQWQNQMGMQGNERTGAAITARQGQGDTATFHFYDNFQEALLNTGRQIIDLFPHVYDTKRVLQISADDGSMMEVLLDPGAKRAAGMKSAQDGATLQRVFNPAIGQYDVRVDTGPAFGTKRKEAAQALTLLLTQAPQLTGVIGDLLLSSLDFDKAQEAAQRLKRMVPPQALGQGPSEQEKQMQLQLTQSQAALTKTLEQHAKDQLKLVGKDEMRDIDVYEAETKRMQALRVALPMDQQGLQAMIHQLVGDSLAVHLGDVLNANKGELASQGPSPLNGPQGSQTQGPAPMPQPTPNPRQFPVYGKPKEAETATQGATSPLK